MGSIPQRFGHMCVEATSAATAMGHHRRHRGAWGRPQRVTIELTNYKQKHKCEKPLQIRNDW